MIKLAVFAAEGCEEVEALTVVDLLRRAGMHTDIISMSDNKAVSGSHKIVFGAEKRFSEFNPAEYDAAILPGGMPGTNNLLSHGSLCGILKQYAAEGKLLAAICAAPSVLGQLNLLDGKTATCYPGFEDKLVGATVVGGKVAVDGNIITSRGMGTAIDFGLAIIEYFSDESIVKDLADKIMY